jgi:hypothetical protein
MSVLYPVQKQAEFLKPLKKLRSQDCRVRGFRQMQLKDRLQKPSRAPVGLSVYLNKLPQVRGVNAQRKDGDPQVRHLPSGNLAKKESTPENANKAKGGIL